MSHLGERKQVTDENQKCDLKSKFLAGVEKNLDSIKTMYPGYSMRVYHNAPSDKRFDIRFLYGT